MTKEQLAAMLNGREYGNEITKDEEQQAKGAGLVVAFGASDDLIEFRGAIYDEQGCYSGGYVHFTKEGKFATNEHLDYIHQLRGELGLDIQYKFNEIEACWDAPEQPCWTYKTEIPHETFDVMEDGEVYCRGIVFSVEDLF